MLVRRLNHRLSQACKSVIDEKCGDKCPLNEPETCGGRVLRCLTDIQENITDADCKKEVFYFMKMEVKDFRNDVLLAEACRQDVDTFCAKIEPGACLLCPGSLKSCIPGPHCYCGKRLSIS
jgi:golgi apparatus protein 1